MSRIVGVVALVGYILTILAANFAIEHFGFVSVGFGLLAPAGVYFVGLSFTLRDITQRALGRLPVIAAILVGAGLSYFISPAFALASGLAFLASESADLAVYTPLEKRGWMTAVVASNVVGAIVDSALFLWLAFGSLAFLKGQVVGKLWMTALTVGLIVTYRAFRSARAVEAEA